jgi:hypothetical protein
MMKDFTNWLNMRPGFVYFEGSYMDLMDEYLVYEAYDMEITWP